MACTVPLRFNASASVFATRLRPFLSGSPLASHGATFACAGLVNGVDPRFLAAIAKAETALGAAGDGPRFNNPFGIGPHRRFSSFGAAIEYAGALIGGSLYAKSGRTTIPQIGSRWAPVGASNDPNNLNNNWTTNVSAAYQALGGDPSGQVAGLSDDELIARAGNPADTTGGIPGLPGLGTEAEVTDLLDPRNWLAGLLGPLFSSALWARVLMAVGGAVAVILALVLLFKMRG